MVEDPVPLRAARAESELRARRQCDTGNVPDLDRVPGQPGIAGRLGYVPHHLPHQSVSQGARPPPPVRGRAPAPRGGCTTASCGRCCDRWRQARRRHAQVSRGSDSTSASSSGGPELEVLQVAADVLIGGAGGNITVNVGSNGLFVVDAGTEGASANVVAAIRTISDRPIRTWPVRMRTTSAGTLRSGRSVREFYPRKSRGRGGDRRA